MEDNEKVLEDIKIYIAYLKENFERAESYFNMILKNHCIKENELKINYLKDLLEFVRQKIFNENEINYNIATIKDNYNCVIINYLNWCNQELNYIFNFLEKEFKITLIKA